MNRTLSLLMLALFGAFGACGEPTQIEEPTRQVAPVRPQPEPVEHGWEADAKVEVAPQIPVEKPVPIDPVKALYGPSKPFLTPQSTLPMVVPGEVVLFVSVNRPADLLDQLGWSTILKERKDWATLASVAVTSQVGHNLVELANFKEIGVDPNGPASVFVFHARQLALGFSVTLSDQALFSSWVRRMGERLRERLDEKKVGVWNLFIVDDARVALLVKPDMVLVLVAGGEPAQRMAALDRLAQVKTSDSLASQTAPWQALEAMNYGSAILAYASGGAFGRALEANREQHLERFIEENNQVPLPPRVEAETVEQVAEREAEAMRQAEEQTRWLKWKRTGSQVKNKFFMDTLGRTTWVMGADITDKGILFKGWTGFEGPNLVKGAFIRSSGIPALFRMMPDRPAVATYWNIDPAYLFAFLERAAELNGSTWERWLAEATQNHGVDVARLVKCLSGEATLTLWGEPDFAFPDVDDMLAPLRGALALRLTDSAYIQEALKNNLVRLLPEGRVVWEEKTKEWELDLSGHLFFVKVANDHLLLSTEKELDLGKAPELLVPAPEVETVPAAKTLMAFSDAAVLWTANVSPSLSLALAWSVGFYNGPLSFAWMDDRLGGPCPTLKRWEFAHRAQFDSLLAQYRKGREQMEKETERLTREVQKGMADAVQDSGYFGLVMRPVEQGWEWFGGYLTPKIGLTALVSNGVVRIAKAAKVYQDGMAVVWKQRDDLFRILDLLEPLVVKPKPVLPPGAHWSPFFPAPTTNGAEVDSPPAKATDETALPGPVPAPEVPGEAAGKAEEPGKKPDSLQK